MHHHDSTSRHTDLAESTVRLRRRQSAGAVLAVAALAVVAALPLSTSQAGTTPDPWLRPEAVPAPPDNPPNDARVHLGRVLFFDPRLSGSNAVSCASCHNPGLGWSDGLPTAMGKGARLLKRHTPTVVNTAYNPIQMWDGRKRTLEDQALGPIESPDEMDMALETLVPKLSALSEYRALFEAAYPGEGINSKTIAKAIASYERTVVSGLAPFDRWRLGETHAISASAQRGFEVFQNQGNCTKCHSGFNFTDNGFHNIGVNSTSGEDDAGRHAILKLPSMKGAFKTPTLREIAITGPYMHNGIYRTLEEVVEHYDRGGDTKTNLSPDMKPLNLSAQQKADLVAFMNTLTSPPTVVALPRLPTR